MTTAADFIKRNEEAKKAEIQQDVQNQATDGAAEASSRIRNPNAELHEKIQWPVHAQVVLELPHRKVNTIQIVDSAGQVMFNGILKDSEATALASYLNWTHIQIQRMRAAAAAE